MGDVQGKHDDRVTAQLIKWRDDLISLDRRNRALYFKHTKTSSLEIVHPSCASLLALLDCRPGYVDFYAAVTSLQAASDSSQSLEKKARNPRPDEMVCHKWSGTAVKGELTPAAASEMNKVLRTLCRQSRTDYVDKGLQTLYLGLGMLEWTDPREADQANFAPVVLVPVELIQTAPREPFRLHALGEDRILNPSLRLKLENDFGLTLPSLDDDDLDIDEYLAQVRLIAAAPFQWTTHDRAVLARFSFHKEAMYQDLLENEETVRTHPLVRALACPDSVALDFDFDMPSEEELDKVAPETGMVSILDADSTQRRCIWAARDGRTFVMEGPPGTGKSQTIANMISELLAAGRTVLFVSEKAAALDVVHKRLRKFGLDEYVLPLHDHKATRREVAEQLSKAVSCRPAMSSGLAETDIGSLRKKRASLNRYADAMNKVREPLGCSLFDVIGQVSRLNGSPRPAVQVAVGEGLSSATFGEIHDAASALARAWGPVERRGEFAWRDLAVGTFTKSDHARLTETLEGLLETNTEIARLLGLAVERLYGSPVPGGAAGLNWVHDLVVAVSESRGLDPLWLTHADPSDIDEAIDEVASAQQRRDSAVETLVGLVGAGSENLIAMASAHAKLVSASREVDGWLPSEDWTLDRLTQAAEDIDSLEDEIAGLPILLEQVCKAVSVNMSNDPSLEETQDLVHLLRMAETANRPESEWLNPTRISELLQAQQVLVVMVEQLRIRRDRVLKMFDEAVLTLDVVGLKARFDSVHVGIRKLSPAHVRDRRALARVVRGGRFTDAAVGLLQDVCELQQLMSQLAHFESRSGSLLGTYYEGANTDLERLGSALEVARDALAIAERRVHLAGAMSAVGRGSEPDPATLLRAGSVERIIARVLAQAGSLGFENREFQAMRLSAASDRLRRCSLVIANVMSIYTCLDQLPEEPTCLGTVLAAGRAAAAVVECEQRLEARDGHLSAVLGDSYTGVNTPLLDLRQRVSAAKPVVAALGQAISLSAAERVLSSGLDVREIGEALVQWKRGLADVCGVFDDSAAAPLAADLHSDTAVAEAKLEKLLSTVEDIDEWLAFKQACARVRQLGLGELLDVCITKAFCGPQLPGVFERVCLESWVDAVMQQDQDALAPIPAQDRAALRAEFARLDSEFVRHSASRVMKACNARRPSKSVGAVSIILKEGEKKKRHMPVRELLSRTREEALRLKPCFMMSPLSVSQFLPSDFRFDVILFDEASQIRPHDAINCIYRGNQHVIAGDQQQLPPTSFFEDTSGDQDDDWSEDQLETYESVLDLAKSCSGIPSLPLLWHYRSRHEDLITFSNRSFYKGKLVTYPSAETASPLLGIGFNRVQGEYRRGTTRDNPVEAAKVADLVAHYAKHHRHLSVGVVALSSAQEDAIQNAVDEMRLRDRQIPASFFSDERLDGFFIKNLETVQGDERDVIILSVGYGPDESGRISTNFGPINRAGGYRRLNVAITRARRRLELVTSMSASDIASSAAGNEGVRHLRNYLDYAENGPGTLVRGEGQSLGDVESPFEDEVERVIRSWGYEAKPQVGSANYRIDLALLHPAYPGRYCLAVECDGAMYHSSKVARDRDRLRDQVLEGLGWRIHRIWGPSWYRQRAKTEEVLRHAIETAIASDSTPPRIAQTDDLPPQIIITEVAPVEGFEREVKATPYVVAVPTLGRTERTVAMGDRSASRIMKRLIPEVVRVEQPLRPEVVLERLKDAWGVKRAGSNVQAEFDLALRELVRAGVILKDAFGFLCESDPPARVAPRHPVAGDARTMRSCAFVSPLEFDAAVRAIMENVATIGEHELRRQVAEVFGWERVGCDIASAIDASVKRVSAEDSIDCRILSDAETAKPIHQEQPEQRTRPRTENQPTASQHATSTRMSSPSGFKSVCAVCKLGFGDRSRPVDLRFYESNMTRTVPVHLTCFEAVESGQREMSGYRWDAGRGGLVRGAARQSVSKSQGKPTAAHQTWVEGETAQTDIDLIRGLEAERRIREEEKKQQFGGLYDSSPFD